MADYDFTQLIPYTTKGERKTICDEAHNNGYVMLHDDFTETGGLLTFAKPQSKSDEQLAEEAEQATCEEYLGHSPDVILPTEIWFLLRAFAKKLGYKVE